MAEPNTVELATELTIAWLSNGSTRASADDVAKFLSSMKLALGELSAPAAPAVEDAGPTYEPAVSVRKSLSSPDHIISLIDGKPYRTLKRHLSGHGLTPNEYRERYGLKRDYPMVAASYSESRKALAKVIGLGRKKGEKVSAAQPSAVASEKTGARSKRGKSVSEARAAARAHLGDK